MNQRPAVWIFQAAGRFHGVVMTSSHWESVEARSSFTGSAENFATAYVHFLTEGGNEIPGSRVALAAGQYGETTVIGRLYFARQAATLLKFAKSTANPELSAVLIEKAADLKSRIDDTNAPDRSLMAPDVEDQSGGLLRSARGQR